MASLGKSSKVKNEVLHEKMEPDGENMETEELEDGELSNDDEENVAPLAEVENSLFENTEQQKEDAAKRFSLYGDLTLAVPKEELQDLYDSLNINTENERHYRFNTVHLRGTEKMKTDDVLDYFSGLDPAKVDWLAEGICNVQWDDEILPARALLYLSVKITNSQKRVKQEKGKTRTSESSSESEVDEQEVEISGDSVDASKLPFSLPSGKWRKGQSCAKSKRIIMRYASKDDKAVPGGRHHSHRHGKRSKHKEVHVEEEQNNPWGGLAQTWGRGEGTERILYHSAPPRNVHDLRTSLNDMSESRFADVYLRRAAEIHRRRPPSPPIFLNSSTESDSSDDDFMRRRKLPKMRADIEEEKIKRARLEKAARNNDLRSRINHKITKTVGKPVPTKSAAKKPSPKEEQSEDSEEDVNWADEGGYSDLKMTLDNRRERDSSASESEEDLGLGEPGEMLQIEVDNEYYKERRRRY